MKGDIIKKWIHTIPLAALVVLGVSALTPARGDEPETPLSDTLTYIRDSLDNATGYDVHANVQTGERYPNQYRYTTIATSEFVVPKSIPTILLMADSVP